MREQAGREHEDGDKGGSEGGGEGEREGEKREEGWECIEGSYGGHWRAALATVYADRVAHSCTFHCQCSDPQCHVGMLHCGVWRSCKE